MTIILKSKSVAALAEQPVAQAIAPTAPEQQQEAQVDPAMLTAVKLEIESIGKEQVEIEKLKAAIKDKLDAIAAREKPVLKRMAALRVQVDKLADAFDADVEKEFQLTAGKFVATADKPAMNRSVIELEALKKLLDKQKKGLFFELAQFKVTDIDKYLTPEEAKAHITHGFAVRALSIKRL